MPAYMLMLLLIQPPTPQPPPSAPTAAPPPGMEAPASQPAVNLAVGPMRVELVAIMEGRYRFIETPPGGARPSEMQLQFRVVGERLTEVAKYGKVILTELVDDTGKSLIKPDSYTAEDRSNLRLAGLPPERLRESGLQLVQRADASERAGRKIKTMKGAVRVILAGKYDEVTLINPGAATGKSIDDQRLKDLGIDIRIVPLDDLPNPPPPGRSIAVQIKTKPENVRNIAFHDAWMKPMRTREMPVTLKDGSSATVYGIMGGEFNADTQMVVQVFQSVEDLQVPLDLKDIDLP